MAWVSPTSTSIVDYCGHNPLYTLPKQLPFNVTKDTKLHTALDQLTAWTCDQDHTHYMLLDLGRCVNVASVRGLLNATTNAKEVQVYISNDPTAFGPPILTVTDWTDYSKPDDELYRVEPTTQKTGRYALVVVPCTYGTDNALRWG
jgi:hypothetical protein